MKFLKALTGLFLFIQTNAQTLEWKNVSDSFGTLPSSLRVYKTVSTLNGKPNIAFYVTADLSEKALQFTTDTGKARRYTPMEFYKRSTQPLVVVNGTFFAFEDNRNLNLVIKDGKIVAHNIPSLPGRGKDTFTYTYQLRGVMGITKKRKPDVAWIFSDTALRHAYALQAHPVRFSGTIADPGLRNIKALAVSHHLKLKKWRNMETAIGGGPVLVQQGKIQITNNEELMFAGKAILDKHPRTAMGYTGDGKLIILVIQGRDPGKAEGATLEEEAKMLIDLGCYEALNLDGGGSSCLLVNGKETIKPSDATGERAVPAVFIIKKKK